jgi:acetolactate synthase-1/2/3 large subunit
MIEHGMRAQHLTPVGARIPPTDFAALARSVGCPGARVDQQGAALTAALDQAIGAPGPFVLDVVIDPTVVAPFLRRVEALERQKS